VTWPVDADTSPSGDPDGDGMPNAWEQFLAADPLAGDAPSFVPNLRAEEGRTFLRWSLLIDPQTDQSLFVRTSTDLATWSEAILVYPSAAALPGGMSVTRSGAEGEALQIEIETPEQARFFQRFVLESR
jgi:hypothetical protein